MKQEHEKECNNKTNESKNSHPVGA
jgi:hypothetical protein